MKTQNTFVLFSDADLLNEIIHKSRPDLFDIIYNRYANKVFASCYKILKNDVLAADLCQDVFVKAYSKLTSFKNHSSFSTWLYRIAHNECIDYLRKNKKYKGSYSIDDAINNYLTEKLQEEELCDELEEIDIDKVKNLMSEIPPQDKELLLMKYDLRLSIKEISLTANLSESAVKMRLKRAKTKLTRLYFISKN